MPNSAHPHYLGRTLAHKYALEEVVGAGAMGAVYRARQTTLDKSVAVKILHREHLEEPKFVERFKREAFSASRLDHPNSLHVLDFGEDDGLLFLVMEYAEGDDLRAVMSREWPFDDRRIVSIMAQALSALGAAHDLGIVHRDVKPENILVLHATDDEGNPADLVKVCDFGIAKLPADLANSASSFAVHLTGDGLVVGTPDYMSPEQARGHAVDARSDLYSMGVVLYHMLAGRPPFVGETPLGVALQHVSDPPPPPSQFNDVNPELEAICLAALNKRPDDRYQSAREMRRALRAAVEGYDRSVSMVPVVRSGPSPFSEPRFSTSTAPAALSSGMARATASRRRERARAGVMVLLGGVLAAVGVGAAALAAHQAEVGGVVVVQQAAAAPATTVAGVEEGAPGDERAGAEAKGPWGDDAPADFESHGGAGGPARAEKNGASGARGVAASAAGGDVARGIEAPPFAARRAPTPNGEEPALPRSLLPGTVAIDQPSRGPAAGIATPMVPAMTSAGTVRTAAGARAATNRARAPTASLTPASGASSASTAGSPSEQPAPPADGASARAAIPAEPARSAVTVGSLTTSASMSAAKVRSALSRLPLASCYVQAMRSRDPQAAAATSLAVLRIEVDLDGRVAGAFVTDDGHWPGFGPCVEAMVRGPLLRDVDMGDGVAIVHLALAPR